MRVFPVFAAVVALAALVRVSLASPATDCTDDFDVAITSAGGTLSLVCQAVSELKACVGALDPNDDSAEAKNARSVLQAAELTAAQCTPIAEEQVVLEQAGKNFVVQVPPGGSANIVRDQQTFDLFQVAIGVNQLQQDRATKDEVGALRDRVSTLESTVATLVTLLAADPSAADKLASLVDIRSIATTVAGHTTALNTQGGDIGTIKTDAATLKGRVDNLETEYTAVEGRVTTIEENDNTDIVHKLVDALHAGSDPSADIDSKIQNLLDLDQIQQNSNDITAINSRIDGVDTALNGKAVKGDVRTDAQIMAVVNSMVGSTNALTNAINDPAHVVTAVNGLLDDANSELSKSLSADPDTPRAIRVFRFQQGSWGSSNPTFLTVTAADDFGQSVNVAGSFFVPTKRKLKYQFHIGGDYTDNSGRTVSYRFKCVNGGTTTYLPSTTGHRIYKYTDHNRLDSETFDFVTGEMDAGTWSCNLEINAGTNQPYTWSSGYGEISLIMGDVLPMDPSHELMNKQVPQQIFRQTSGSLSEIVSGSWQVLPGKGIYVHPQNDITVPYHFHIGGHYVDDCGRNVLYRIRCINDEDHTVYLPDSSGHKIYMYTTHSRLDSELFNGISSDFQRGVYTCVPEVVGGSCGRYSWSSGYGEIILTIGAQANPDQVPQQVYYVNTGSDTGNTGTSWGALATAAGDFVQATDKHPVLYLLHTGGDYVDGSGGNMFWRVKCTSAGQSDVYIPDTTGHKKYKYIDHSRLESETFVGVTSALAKGTWRCQEEYRSENAKTYSWASEYGDLSLTMW